MARNTKHLQCRNGIWWINCKIPQSCGLPIAGQHLRQSLRTTSFARAASIRDRTITPLFAASGEHELLTELMRMICKSSDSARDLVAALAAEAEVDHISGIKSSVRGVVRFGDFMEKYIAYLDASKSLESGSMKKYGGDARIWTDVIGADADAQTITKSDIAKHRDFLLSLPRSYFIRSEATRNRTPQPGETTMSAKTVHSKLTTLHAAYEWAIGDGYLICRNPTEGVSVKVREAKGKQCPTVEEADSLCAMTRTTHSVGEMEWDTIPTILRYTGARFAEIAGLSAEDIVTQGGVRCFFINGRRRTIKNKQSERLVPVAGIIADQVDDLLKKAGGSGRLFPNVGDSKDGVKIGNTLNSKWNIAAKAVGPFSFHCFRIYANDKMMQGGVDSVDRDRIFGWKNKATQSAYTTRDLSRFLAAVDSIAEQERQQR